MITTNYHVNLKGRFNMDKKILVFLSRPNPFTCEQQQFLKNLTTKLKTFDIETITLEADDYDLTDSMNYLNGMIKRCYGVVIVGFKQIFIEKGTKKKDAETNKNFFKPNEEDLTNQALTSPFCHIEGTIGLLNNLPTLIINEEGVREEGIISGGRFSVKTKKFNLKRMDDFFKSKTINKQISVWVGQVTDKYLFYTLNKT